METEGEKKPLRLVGGDRSNLSVAPSVLYHAWFLGATEGAHNLHDEATAGGKAKSVAFLLTVEYMRTSRKDILEIIII